MSVLPVGFGASGGYEIGHSLRVRRSAGAYLGRTYSTNGDGRTKLSFRLLTKRGNLATNSCILYGYDGSSASDTLFGFNSSDQLQLTFGGAAGNTSVTSAVFRDPSAWYDILLVIDTTQAQTAHSASDSRIRITMNGVQQVTSGTLPAQNATHQFYMNNANNKIGRYSTVSSWDYDGYVADLFICDGLVKAATDFGQQDANGVWVPKAYTGTYGNNGFHLDFSDATSLTTLGYDAAGSNDWTLNNVSLTAGVTYDHMVDTPTNNYATLNPVFPVIATVADGALKATGNPSSAQGRGTQLIKAKTYFETVNTVIGAGSILVGVYNTSTGLYYAYAQDGQKWNGAALSAYGATYTTNDVIGIAVDPDALTLEFFKNGTSQGVINAAFPAGDYVAFLYVSNNTANAINFGQRPFAYTPPTGFKALCTANMPAVAITKPALHFNAKTRTGTGAAFNVTGEAFPPGLVWSKGRSGATDHALYDIVRGVQKQLESNTTDAESTEAQGVTAFNSDGYSGGTLAQLNTNAATYIDWMWKANGAGSSNTDGSITSTVSANVLAGLSIVKIAAGTAANATVGHGLGKVLSLIIAKAFSQTTEWPVYHGSLANTEYLALNTTAAKATGATYWNSTTPTSSVFNLGSSTNTNNTNGMLFYCFAEIPGYSKFGSYVGNGSADGPFVYCGFRPKYVLVTCSSAINGWYVLDAARDTYNAMVTGLLPNSSGAEPGGSPTLDATANGFKIRDSGGGLNTSTATYIFAAFAEHPFGGSNCAPSPAR